MKKIFNYTMIAIVAAGVLAVGIYLLTHQPSAPPPAESYEVRQAREAATIAQLNRDMDGARFNQAIGQAVTITLLIVVIGLLIFFCYQYHAASLHRRRLEAERAEEERHRLQPDQQGNFPQWFDAPSGIIIAPPPGNMVQPVPTHYAPHYAGATASGRGPALAELPAGPATSTGSANVPSFAELFKRGDIGRDDSQMILGVSPAGDLIKGSWLDLYSSGIAGISGSGKTTTVRFLISQAVTLGSKLIIIDPERDSELDDSLAVTLDPLQDRFLFNPASDDDEILAALHVADQELKARRSGNKNRDPIIICVDELTTLMRNKDINTQLSELLQNISQGGRKHGIYAMCMGQIWKGTTSGGTELRDSFASFYIHRLKANQARLIIPGDEARQVEKLDKGQAYLAKTNGDIIPVNIPLTTGEDVVKVASLIVDKNRQSLTGSYPELNHSLTRVEAKTPSAGDVQLIQWFNQGKT